MREKRKCLKESGGGNLVGSLSFPFNESLHLCSVLQLLRYNSTPSSSTTYKNGSLENTRAGNRSSHGKNFQSGSEYTRFRAHCKTLRFDKTSSVKQVNNWRWKENKETENACLKPKSLHVLREDREEQIFL